MDCIKCGETISNENTITEKGKREASISQMCEVCFDNITFCIEENIHKLDKFVCGLVTNNESLVLGGGSLRKLVDGSDTVVDYDLFVLDVNSISKIRSELEKECNLVFACPEGKLFTYKTKNSIKIQLINKRSYTDLIDLVDSFDIIACCAAWDGVNFYKNSRFVFDVLNKQININKIEFPLATFRRVNKYVLKGYTPTISCAEKYIQIVRDGDFSDDDLFLYNID